MPVNEASVISINIGKRKDRRTDFVGIPSSFTWLQNFEGPEIRRTSLLYRSDKSIWLVPVAEGKNS